MIHRKCLIVQQLLNGSKITPMRGEGGEETGHMSYLIVQNLEFEGIFAHSGGPGGGGGGADWKKSYLINGSKLLPWGGYLLRALVAWL